MEELFCWRGIMAYSLLLRDTSENVVGYALADGSQLCIRIAGNAAQAQATVSDGMAEKRMPIVCDGREQFFPWERERRIEWIVIEACGNVLAHGGNVMETKKRKTELPKENNEDECKINGAENVCIESQNNPVFSRLQRRWPPPPCWPSAQYREGMWKEGKSSDCSQ